MKKRMKTSINRLLLLVAVMALWGCSDSSPVTDSLPEADAWQVMLSRSDTGGENVRVALRYGGTEAYGTLIPASSNGGTATWQDGTSPTWPESGTVEVIAFCPAVDALPSMVEATDNVAYLMDYAVTDNPVTGKPQGFTLTHLMARLEVHIKISDDEHHHYEPKEGNIRLCTVGTVDYPKKKVTASGTVTDFALGTFGKEGNNTESVENWTNEAQTVIPQTLKKDIPCLTFKAGDKTYTFTPEEDIVLNPGKNTKLYLGIAYRQDYVTLAEEGIVVSGWSDGTSISGGEATEE